MELAFLFFPTGGLVCLPSFFLFLELGGLGLSALNKHLRCVGVDVNLMWARINDLIVKTLLSVEPSISSRTRQVTGGTSRGKAGFWKESTGRFFSGWV